MSLFKTIAGLLGGAGGRARGKEADGPSEIARTIEHKGFTVHAMPYQAEGGFQTAGRIEKDVDGERKVHTFVRADRHPDKGDAVEFSLMKGRQIIDQQGELVFK